MPGVGKQRGGIRCEAIGCLNENERGVEADPDEERTAEVHGVNMTVRAMMMPIKIAFMARMIVMEVVVVMVAAIHAPSLGHRLIKSQPDSD
ncbi:MAG: hypothetical protein NTAFB05_01470 [Nitrobacter sp.]